MIFKNPPSKLLSLLDNKKAIWLVIFFFGFVYALITFLNHYNFRTSGDPLGIYTNAIQDYAHLRSNYCTLLTPENSHLKTPFFENKLSDHFNLFQFLIAPLHWILGTYTLLFVQWVFILLGGLGIFYLIKHHSGSPKWANLGAIHFFSMWGIYSALGFDYHDNVIAAMLVPWLFLNWRKNSLLLSWILLVLIISTKENMALWMVFISLAFLIWESPTAEKRIHSGLMILSCIAYFLIVTKLIMPSLANEGREYLHFEFEALGENYGDAIINMLSHPFRTISYLFYNHNQSTYGDGIKLELFIMVLLSGGLALFLKPKYLLILIPIFGQKLWNDDMIKWGINDHYSIEFVPILAIALFEVLWSFKSSFRKVSFLSLYIIFIALTGISTIVVLQTRTSKWYKREANNFLSKAHYTRSFDVKALHQKLDSIPDDAVVSAHFRIVPHLALRDTIYEFPTIEKADYIILLTGLPYETWPLSADEYKQAIHNVSHMSEYQKVYDENQTLIYKRKL
jgi:uncharacterized membrane protein